MMKDATHVCPVTGQLYKSDPEEPLNWLKWGAVDQKWWPVGTVPAGNLKLIPPDAPASSLAQPFQIPECLKPAPVIHDQIGVYAALAEELERDTPFTNYFAQYRFVGSRVTCNPPPLDTDQDVLVHVHQTNMAIVQSKLQAAGFVCEGSNPAELNASIDMQSVFFSFRKGDMNYIITSDLEFYNRFSTATELARKWNLLEKADRIQLFQAVLYGKWWA